MGELESTYAVDGEREGRIPMVVNDLSQYRVGMERTPVFIVHRPGDRQHAHDCHNALRTTGVAAFHRSLVEPGRAWDEVLPERLEAASLILILLSEASDASHHFYEEIVRAIARVADTENSEVRVVPILLAGASSDALPYGLSRLQAIRVDELADWPAAAETIASLLDDHENSSVGALPAPPSSWWSWYSARQPTDRGHLSILAVIETMLAMATSAYIAVMFDTVTHILIGACAAPLLLLRSSASVKRGHRWFEDFVESTQKPEGALKSPIGGFVHFVSFFFVVFVGALVVRVVATLRHPVAGVRALPSNWRRCLTSIDTTVPTELVPGYASIPWPWIPKEEEPAAKRRPVWEIIIAIGAGWQGLFLLFRGLGEIFSESATIDAFLWLGSGLALVSFSGYLLMPYIYRFSLKSTAWVWLPLIFVSKTAFVEGMPARERIAELKHGALWRVFRAISFLTLIAAAIRVFVLPNVAQSWNELALAGLANPYLFNGTMEDNALYTWHITAVLNTLVVLGTYYLLIDPAPRRIRIGKWTEAGVESALQALLLLRGTLSLITIAGVLALTIQLAPTLNWPSWLPTFLP